MGLTAGIFLLLSIVPTVYGFKWLSPIISLPVGALGVGLTIYFMRKYPTMLIRIIRVDFRKMEDFERNFRVAFNKNGIRYQRTMEEELYTYAFSGHKLTMTLEPYFMHNLQLNSDVNDQPATSVVLQKVTEKNRPFVEELTALIDQLVIDNPDSW